MKLGDRLKQAGGQDPVEDEEDTEKPRADPYAVIKKKVSSALMQRIAERKNDADMSDDQLLDMARDSLADIMNAEDTALSADEKARLVDEISADVIGYGPITPFLEDDDITEIMANNTDGVWVERRGLLEDTGIAFADDQALRRVIDRIVSAIGRRIDESSPMVDARLPDGSRVNAVIPPLAVDGPALTIRKFSKLVLKADDYVRTGAATPVLVDFLSTCVEGKLNVLVSGGTGTGKTTLLNVLSNFIPPGERIVTIEDAVELKLNQRHVVRLESRPRNIEGSGEVTIRDLVRNALRMRPDRIIVGECRGGEALDMLQAMNTGHEGSLGTLHANTPRDALSRMETMVLMAGLELPIRAIREQIASAIDLIVHISRLRDGSRRITQVVEIVGMENDTITANNLFDFDFGAGVDDNGRFRGLPEPTGIRPSFSERLSDQGFILPAELFSESNVVNDAIAVNRGRR
ncbi:MAG: CpaF family protein [Acidimicrobiales bacterium]|nr:CpaF family protein [Acidimicrobiales bacterium]